MPSPQENSSVTNHLYEYAVVRYLPVIEREEFVNVGLIMMCKRLKWIKVMLRVDESRVSALFPSCCLDTLCSQLASFEKIASGAPGVIGDLDPHERFRWLTAVRSASIQTSRPHPGLTPDLETTFSTLFQELVG